ncbi:NADH-quinone oxidoreductase subunit L [Lutimaribacter sp. EGI FJ00015]|uniref:NADH-quinone oxidoreductase subunit L n=1 Tax=Lutimaribacter degradans TaxID=2945989 RepID=A0ACC5ZRB1_9RHOB|nr:NADH-quinone oxidoreductase subunit L [Lutimaribacter sp. EGI FJ00013]MCM2560873.1 NADH-quinone oxidoreductase subunit L [Lutimaribacter sp. EGI FJ00013]MCO0612182.1 NADH-quinone oxidoreductase subunit L [Lutimaribacter sp. EGI FJ00015]MCO0634698.1 NADH-quinone oxidoreductase subunit L [Lutimaribacter sp. EGI FJ00014]
MAQIILFAPLIGALIAGFGWRLIGETAAQWLTTGLLFLSCLLSWVVFLTLDASVTQQIHILDFIRSGTLDTAWSIRLDRLTAIMLIVVTSVSALVHLYSFGYMAHDHAWKEGEHYKARFFAYLSFFTFAMLMLVTADNLVQMFFGWEGVGVASYLLIGFYYKKPSANAAAIKAFVVNRVGDFGFVLGIVALYFLVDSIKMDDVFAAAPQLAETQLTFLWTDWNAANLIAFLLFIGAMGKSAQLFLHTWLPDAMEGPTPVSALIHAATMVTAGVFLVCRMSPVFEYAPEAKTFIVYIGATTAFFAATVGLVQNDIKRVIAYSTCSQLGYMFVAAGVGVYSVAMFHLLTHAFFKAMLFLGAGSVIHGMHHEQDMRNYGGLRKKFPMTFWAMLIGTLAITGVGIPLTTIGFAGFLSKDAVIESAYAGTNGGYAFWMLVIAALFTSFYSWRLMFLTFWGEPRGDKHTHEHAHESPTVMLVPLGVLAIGAVFSGMVWYNSFFGHTDTVGKFFGVPYAEAEAHGDAEGEAAAEGEHHYVLTGAPGEGAIHVAPGNTVLDDAHKVPKWVKVSPFIAMILGLAVAWWFYIVNPAMPKRVAEVNRPLYLFLLNKWYFDEIYDFVFVKPARWIGGFFWKRGDGNVIDGAINGVSMGVIPFVTRLAGRAQSGYIFTYAFWMVIGIAVLVTWMSLTGGAQ